MPGFKVPGFSNSPLPDGVSTPSSISEFVREHRWRINILDPVKEILLYAYKVTRPAHEFDKMVMHRGQDEIYMPGKTRWLPIDIIFYEALVNNVVATDFINKWRTDLIVNEDSSNARSNFKREMILSLTDGLGEELYQYCLTGAWPIKIAGSELTYDGSNISTISVTISYDKCVEKAIK